MKTSKNKLIVVLGVILAIVAVLNPIVATAKGPSGNSGNGNVGRPPKPLPNSANVANQANSRQGQATIWADDWGNSTIFKNANAGTGVKYGNGKGTELGNGTTKNANVGTGVKYGNGIGTALGNVNGTGTPSGNGTPTATALPPATAPPAVTALPPATALPTATAPPVAVAPTRRPSSVATSISTSRHSRRQRQAGLPAKGQLLPGNSVCCRAPHLRESGVFRPSDQDHQSGRQRGDLELHAPRHRLHNRAGLQSGLGP